MSFVAEGSTDARIGGTALARAQILRSRQLAGPLMSTSGVVANAPMADQLEMEALSRKTERAPDEGIGRDLP